MKKIKKLVSGIMAIATITTCAFAAVGCKAKETEKEDTAYTQNGGVVITDGESNGISFTATTIAAEDYDEYGVSATAESAVELIATVTPATATLESVTWSVSWYDTGSGTTQGLDVTDYVTVVQSTDNKLSATVTCLKPFSYQIAVSVTVVDYAEKTLTKTCVCDYVFKITSYSYVKIGDSYSSENAFYNTATVSTNTAFTPSCLGTSGTIDVSVYSHSAYITFNQTFIDAMTAAGFTCSNTSMSVADIAYSGNLGLNALSETDRTAVVNGTKEDAYVQAMQDLGGDTVIGSIHVSSTYSAAYLMYSADYAIKVDGESFSVAVESLSLNDTDLLF